MKRLGLVFAIALIAILLLPSATTQSADTAIGTKRVLGNGIEAVYLGKTTDGNYLWQATFGSPKYCDDLVTPIHCQWGYDSETNEWFAKANLFNATVKGNNVSVEYKGSKMDWQSQFEVKAVAQIDNYPTLLIYDPINENYIGNTLQWDYGNGITRNVRLIEGMLQEYYTIDKLPGGDITIKANVNRDAGFVWTRPAVAWDNDNKPVDLGLNEYDITLTVNTMKGATFPITIDPDISFNTSISDGYIWNYGTNYTTIHDGDSGGVFVSGNTLGCGQDAGVYSIFRGYVYFNTSAIPVGANITNATLKLYGQADSSSSDFNVVTREGMPTYPHDPLETTDYNYTHYTGDGGSFNTSTFNTTRYNNITLNASWVQAGVGAATKLALISSKDIDATAPTYIEYVTFWSAEKGTGYYPQLVVTYTASAIPTIATHNATYVTRTTARLNSYLTDDGGEYCDVRFQYGNSTGNYTLNTTWVNDTYLTGDSPYADITSLSLNTTYFFRVQATNTMGMANGSELNFTTYPTINEPTNFIAYPNSTSISLTWIKGVNAAYTMIRGQAGAYPVNYTDGKQVYNGSMSTALDTGLTLGTTYYYRSWSYDSMDYSTNYTDILMTTTAFTEVTQDTPAAPTTPSNWWGMPDYTNLANIAGYGIVNEIADNFEIPRNTFWMSLILIGIMCIGLFIYSVQHNVTVALMLTGAMIVVASIAGLLPLFLLAVIGIPMGGIMLVKRRL